MAHESRLSFSTQEILANVPVAEPLIVKGVRCHGGFDADGNYHSPRTLWRNPAVAAWQEQHVRTSGMPLFAIPDDAVPPHAPSVAQAKFLLRSGVREPIVRILSEIAIVEGFGAMIRELPVPSLKSFIREDVTGTALEHDASLRDELMAVRALSADRGAGYGPLLRTRDRLVRVAILWALLVVIFLVIWQLLQPQPRSHPPRPRPPITGP